MIYLIVALGASIIGALSGIGGGVIIKPLLDLTSSYDVSTVSLLSSFTVLSMAIAAIIKHVFYKTEFQKKTAILLAIGAMSGGVLGDTLLSKLIEFSSNEELIKQTQNICLLILLVMVLIYINKFKEKLRFKIENKILIIIIGIVLGVMSTFVGIGGGPINIVALTLFFSMPTKDAAVNSLILILFSQSAKIVNITFTKGLGSYDLTMLIYMIPAGVIGGIVGSKLNKLLSSKYITKVFNVVLVFIILVTTFNIVR